MRNVSNGDLVSTIFSSVNTSVPLEIFAALHKAGLTKASAIAGFVVLGSARIRASMSAPNLVAQAKLSISRLADLGGISNRSAASALQDLQRKGLIEAVSHTREGTVWEITERFIEILKEGCTPRSIRGSSAKRGHLTNPSPSSSIQTRTSSCPADRNLAAESKNDNGMPPTQQQRTPDPETHPSPEERKRMVMSARQAGMTLIEFMARKHSMSDSGCTAEPSRQNKASYHAKTTQPVTPTNSLSRRCASKREARSERFTIGQIKHILRRLKESGASNPVETAHEIIWAVKHGWFAQAGLKEKIGTWGCALTALRWVEQGRWTTPGGCQPSGIPERDLLMHAKQVLTHAKTAHIKQHLLD